MVELKYAWEYDVLGIYNYKTPGKLDRLINHIKLKHATLEGDVVEAGVFRGAQTLAIALLLKELGSDKRVFAFDSFKGFPPVYSPNDSVSIFEDLHESGKITSDHLSQVRRNIEIKNMIGGGLEKNNISSSGDFSMNNLSLLRRKIDYLGLDNICLIDGDFSDTMSEASKRGPAKVMASIIDCDLYESYKITLRFLRDRLVNDSLTYLDEYFSLKFPGARIATDSFLEINGHFQLERDDDQPADFERWCIRKLKS
jgi:hypothetical protein